MKKILTWVLGAMVVVGVVWAAQQTPVSTDTFQEAFGKLDNNDDEFYSFMDANTIGEEVQAYDADTAKTDTNNTWSGTQAFQNPAFSLGVDDTTDGILTIYGDGSNTGGSLWLYNGASEDDSIEYWSIASYADSFAIRSESSPVAYFTTSGGLELTSITASGAVSAGSLTVESNTVDFGDVTEDYVLTFNASTNTWSGEAASGGTTLPADPGADRYLMWDDSETGSELTWVELSGGVADDSLLEVKLDSTNAPTDNYILSYDDASGGFTWVAPGSGTGDLLADGTVPLTANWDVGAYTITGTQFISDIAIGTAPFVVTSTTVVTNLNADTVDGESASAFEDADAAIVKSDEAETLSAAWDLGTPSAIVLTNASGTASININGTVGATTPAAGTFTTLSAGAAGFTVDADGDTTVKSLTTGSSTDPSIGFNVTDADDTDWWIGVNADAGASSDDNLEFRLSNTPGTSVMAYIEPDTGDTVLNGSLFILEQAEAGTDKAGYGQIWVNTATPNELWWTNDAGTDVQLGVGGSETNNLETVATGITSGEIPIGTDTDTITYGTDLPTATTIGSGYIYRAGGTDVADADVADNITITAGSQIASGSPTFTSLTSSYTIVTPQSLSVTTEDDVTVGTELTSSVVLLTGDNDSDDDTLTLQDGVTAGTILTFICVAGLDDTDDALIIDVETDSTCLGCPDSGIFTYETAGSQLTLYWTGSAWVYMGSVIGE